MPMCEPTYLVPQPYKGQTVRIECSCGWRKTVRNPDVALEKIDKHMFPCGHRNDRESWDRY